MKEEVKNRKRHELLHRYTDLAATIHLLRERELTLLDPKSWDDKNDLSFLEEYKRSKKLKSVLALCFSHRQTPVEPYHHWRIFASGPTGVCIQFDKTRLVSVFEDEGIMHGHVSYMSLPTLSGAVNKGNVSLDDLPFIKGSRYKDEREYRAIFVDNYKCKASHAVAIDLSLICRVTLSPWLPTGLADAVKDALRSFAEGEDLDVRHSTLRNNKKWRSHGTQLGKGGRQCGQLD